MQIITALEPFWGVCNLRQSGEIYPVHCVLISYGSKHGSKCGLAMGQPNRQLSPPNLDLRHIQDHFGFTFPRIALIRFSGVFSRSVSEPSSGTEKFSASDGNLLPCFQHGSKTWVRLFSLTRSREPFPTQGIVIVP